LHAFCFFISAEISHVRNATNRSIFRGCIDTDIDECAVNNGSCHYLATCRNTIGSFSCACRLGYTGNGFYCWGKSLTKIAYSLLFRHSHSKSILHLTLPAKHICSFFTMRLTFDVHVFFTKRSRSKYLSIGFIC